MASIKIIAGDYAQIECIIGIATITEHIEKVRKSRRKKSQLIIIHETPLLILAIHIFSLFFLSFIYEFSLK